MVLVKKKLNQILNLIFENLNKDLYEKLYSNLKYLYNGYNINNKKGGLFTPFSLMISLSEIGKQGKNAPEFYLEKNSVFSKLILLI